MTERTKTGLQIIQASLLIGLFGNFMLRHTPWGLNAFLIVAVFVAGLLLLWRAHRPELLNKTNVSLAAAMVFFASMFLIRDAEELLVFDTLAIIVLMGVMLLASYDVKAHIGGAFHYVASVIGAGLNSAFGGFVLLGADIDWRTMPGNSVSRNVFAVLRGLAIALPLLLVFGGLFVAADAVFARWVNRALNFDVDVIVSHVIITSILAWLTAGYFRSAVITSAWTAGSQPASAPGGNASVNERGDQAPDTVSTGSGSDREPAGPTKSSPLSQGAPDATQSAPSSKGEADVTKSSPPSKGGVAAASADGVVNGRQASEPTSFVANFTSEQTEPENSLPNNASILEHINISDAPDGKQSSPPYEGGVAAASADGVVLSPAATEEKKRDWQTLDNSELPSVFTLGTVETVIILGLVNLLFAGFVAAQLPYLFGGMDLVQNTPDFKLAEYARRGFGELVFVSALVLPMLLISHWLIRRDGSRAAGLFRILAGVQIALLFVIMASAAQRLLLYTGDLGYGLTTDRFYPMVLMIWLAVVFAWFSASVLIAGARNRFAWGALWAGVVILGATNLMNPHAFIARTNIQLMQQGRDFDAYYNADLSDDALPTLIESFEHLNSDDALSTYYRLRYRACRKAETGEGDDLRSWNLSRSEANRILTAVGIPIAKSSACMTAWQGD